MGALKFALHVFPGPTRNVLSSYTRAGLQASLFFEYPLPSDTDGPSIFHIAMVLTIQFPIGNSVLANETIVRPLCLRRIAPSCRVSSHSQSRPKFRGIVSLFQRVSSGKFLLRVHRGPIGSSIGGFSTSR